MHVKKSRVKFRVWHTPHQTLLSFYPSTKLITNLPPKIFGCTAFVHDQKLNPNKLDSKAIKCILLGNSHIKKGYKFHCPSKKTNLSQYRCHILWRQFILFQRCHSEGESDNWWKLTLGNYYTKMCLGICLRHCSINCTRINPKNCIQIWPIRICLKIHLTEAWINH